MNTNQKPEKYLSQNKDGFVCSYDSTTHRCVGVILSTGDNVELYEKKHDEYIDQLDPKYETSN